MKKIIFISLILLSTVGYSQSIKWLTFQEAIELNKKNPRNILIDVYTDWCGWCKVMDKQTFNNDTIINIVNKYFYAVKLNAETRDTIYFQNRMFVNENRGGRSPHNLAIALLQGKMSYPNIVFLNKENQLLGAIPGFKKPEDMHPILDYIIKEKYRDKVDLGTYIDEFKGAQ